MTSPQFPILLNTSYFVQHKGERTCGDKRLSLNFSNPKTFLSQGDTPVSDNAKKSMVDGFLSLCGK
jgi:hypothetical protein